MPNRATKFVSAIFASILAGAPLTTVSHSATGAAEDCLSGPKGSTPQGGHWYYRIDRATKRHCWYLGDERDKLSQTAPLNSSPSAKPPAPEAETTMQRSVANARAELPAETRVEPPNGSTQLAPARAGLGEDSGSAGMPLSAVASRWPEPSGVSPAANTRPTTSNLSANVPSNSVAAPPVAVASLATADSSPQSQPSSIPTLLVAIVGASALAGIMAGVIFKFGSPHRPRRGEIRVHRGPIWESTDDDGIVLSDHPRANALARRGRFPGELDEAPDRNDRIAEFFAHISRPAPT
jgi:hypothetical protein